MEGKANQEFIWWANLGLIYCQEKMKREVCRGTILVFENAFLTCIFNILSVLFLLFLDDGMSSVICFLIIEVLMFAGNNEHNIWWISVISYLDGTTYLPI